MPSPTEELIRRYFAALNQRDPEALLACLADGIEHQVNQASVRNGKAAFGEFIETMRRHYDERIEGLVVLTDAAGERAAAEYTADGAYRVRAEGLPPARGQRYSIPVGCFFSVRNGAITRVTTYLNVGDWVRQLEAVNQA